MAHLAQRFATRYGLLRYAHTTNLGDEIQSLAAKRFLPRVDCTLDRDRLHSLGWRAVHPIKLIMNGWFTHHPEHWPPHRSIFPLAVSFHLSDQITASGFSAAEELVVGDNAAWLRRHGPIGARDQCTLELLRINGIDAWYSGCLTLTLNPPPGIVRQDYVVINDLSDEVAATIRQQRAAGPILRTTHTETHTRRSRSRFGLAERLLRIYAGARCVVTSRLHCALPCLAMGTPVLLLPPSSNMKRYSGLLNLVHHCSVEEFRLGRSAFDLENPPLNPAAFLPLRNKLIDLCSAFTGSEVSHELRTQESLETPWRTGSSLPPLNRT